MDVGSTNIKWCLCDTETGGLSARKRIAFPQRLPEGGKYIFEVDAEAGICRLLRCPCEAYISLSSELEILSPWPRWASQDQKSITVTKEYAAAHLNKLNAQKLRA